MNESYSEFSAYVVSLLANRWPSISYEKAALGDQTIVQRRLAASMLSNKEALWSVLWIDMILYF